jgi:glycosyltransferase involved in cell wall biosynthesis
MRILHVIDSGGLYGAEVMLLHLMEAQVQLGLEPVLASIGSPACGDKPLEVEARRRGLRVEPFRMRPGPNWAGAFAILRFARREGSELLHSHGYKGNILFGLLPKSLRHLPMVTTLHGWTWTCGLTRMRAYEWLDGLCLRFVDRVVLVNQAMLDHPRLQFGKRSRLVVSENGIPLAVPKPGNAEPDLNPEILAFARRGFSIVAVGRLSREKGFDLLLAAVAGLVIQGKDVRLLIMGEGDLRESLLLQARALGVADRLRLSGYVPDAGKYLSHFNCFAIPSLTEGLPMVLLEAMAGGVPIVASRVGGMPEALDNIRAGVLVESGDVAALLAGVAEVMDHPAAAAARAEHAARRVRETYSSRAMAERYLKVYRQLLPETAARSAKVQSETICP